MRVLCVAAVLPACVAVLLGQLDEAIRSYEDSLMEDRSEEVEKLLKQTRAAKKKAERPPRDRRETAERPPRDHRETTET